MQETQFDSQVRKICWRRGRLPTPVFLDFPCGSAGKKSTCHVGYLGFIPGMGRSPGAVDSYPLQYSGLENSMDCIVHGVAKHWTWLSNFHFHDYVVFYHFFHPIFNLIFSIFSLWYSGAIFWGEIRKISFTCSTNGSFYFSEHVHTSFILIS